MIKLSFNVLNEENSTNPLQSQSNPQVEVPETSETKGSGMEAWQKYQTKLLHWRLESPHVRSRSVPRIFKYNENPLSKKRSSSLSDVDQINFRYVSIHAKPRSKELKYLSYSSKLHPVDSKIDNSAMTSIEIE